MRLMNKINKNRWLAMGHLKKTVECGDGHFPIQTGRMPCMHSCLSVPSLPVVLCIVTNIGASRNRIAGRESLSMQGCPRLPK